MAQKSKLDSAVDRARGVAQPEPEMAMATIGVSQLAELTGMNEDVQRFDAGTLVNAIKAQGYVSGERFLDLKEGEMASGYLLERSTAIVADPNTGLDREVARWHFELDSGARVSHLGSAQLDRQLESLPLDGTTHVLFARGVKVATKRGRQMTEWLVVHKVRARAPQTPQHENLLAAPVATP